MTAQAITIFLADDHAMFRHGMEALIGNENRIRMIGQCGDGLKVLGLIQQLQPDVAVLDISMSGLNGLDICGEITRKVPGVNVLILTMHDDEELIAKALERGASGYLLKDSAGEDLLDAIWAVARGELFLGPGISKGVLSMIGKGDDDPYDQLTMREREILQLIAEGKTNPRIARDLSLSIKTVNTHRMHLMQKLKIHDLTSLVKYALKKGIVTLC